jgi:hypothetical protein
MNRIPPAPGEMRYPYSAWRPKEAREVKRATRPMAREKMLARTPGMASKGLLTWDVDCISNLIKPSGT